MSCAPAKSKLKGRWTRDAKRQRQDVKVAAKGSGKSRGDTGMHEFTFSEKLIKCAAKVPSTSAVVMKRRRNKLDVEDFNAYKDGGDVRVITSSNLRVTQDDFRPLGVHDDDSKSTTTTIVVKPLLILDLNGILCHRVRKERADLYPHLPYRTAVDRIANTPVIPRPHIDEFLTTLSEHFCLAIWTSAKPKTAKSLLKALVPESISTHLLFAWSQKHCDRLEKLEVDTTRNDTVFLKSLAKVWRTFPLWNPSNTLLIDDSPDKCPELKNTIHPPPLHGKQLLPQHDNGCGSAFLMSDEENAARQHVFFATLVQKHFWEPHEAWPNDKNQVGDAEAKLAEVLEQSATCHMGWRGEQKS
jgi:hypothetical protein